VSEPRVGHVNSDHLWFGANQGADAAFRDFKESGLSESTVVAVVKKSDHDAVVKERDALTAMVAMQASGNTLIAALDEVTKELAAEKERADNLQKNLSACEFNFDLLQETHERVCKERDALAEKLKENGNATK